MENADATLDESLAAADVVVVRGSGVGSDALVEETPRASCSIRRGSWPATIATSCSRQVARMPAAPRNSQTCSAGCWTMTGYRRARSEAAEGYVADFCALSERESARLDR